MPMNTIMNSAVIFLPSVALVFLTYSVLLFMFKGRVAGIKKHQARLQSIADPVKENEIFSDVINVSDNFENLFEMPVLFYIASLVIFVLSRVDQTYLALTWLYVILRIVHSYVHCTSNKIKFRFRFFGLSVLVLLIIWTRIAVQILTS